MSKSPLTSVYIRAPTRQRKRATCIFCSYRFLHSSLGTLQQQSPAQSASQVADNTSSPQPSDLSRDRKATQTFRPQPNRPHVRKWDGELVPKPLDRPLGLRHPPQPGQNTGIDDRTLKQRRDDFVSYDKHLQRRQDLIKNLYQKNYFRDVGNIGTVHKGKSILAPTTPFRANLALYFPNLQGRTLVKGSPGNVDTTPALKGKVSIISFLSGSWAKEQCSTFVGEKENPDLHEYLASESAQSVAQMVEINVEENQLKWVLVRMFFGSLRRKLENSMWSRYFLVKRGVDDEIKDALGIWNSKVGYVYLLDGACRVRWAGNGPAKDQEKQSLVNCVKRLVDEAHGVQKLRTAGRHSGPPRSATTTASSQQR